MMSLRAMFNRYRWVIAGTAAASIVLAAAGAGWSHHLRVKARGHRGIPGQYHYRPDVSPSPERALSAIALPMLPPKESAPANGAVGSAVASKDIRYFQWQTDTRLQRDQCAITRFGLVTERTGRIRASLQADQNTADVLAEMQKRAKEAGNPAIKQTTHIKRNEFHVVVRGYGANQTRTAPDSTALGKPLLFRVEMCPFWVQNGESRDMVWDLNVQGVKDYFDLIDRVEVDFWFR